MAIIFVSHSNKDEEIINFFTKIFANSKVQAIYEEFEKILGKEITSEKIQSDINQSNAVFILLSENTQSLPHTRDWILWEAGMASNKDIWVFIPADINMNLNIITPKLTHLVLYRLDKNWQRYIFQIVQSYDDSNILPVTVVTGGIGALIGSAINEKEPAGGAILGGASGVVGGLILHEIFKPKAPVGYPVKCPSCSSFYYLHSGEQYFRCPICNKILGINLQE